MARADSEDVAEHAPTTTVVAAKALMRKIRHALQIAVKTAPSQMDDDRKTNQETLPDRALILTFRPTVKLAANDEATEIQKTI